ncbi:HNH endonuclease [Streptoalloteichus tenebrarius]|uniref:HNH endonuclease n=1 Tax=Streptoalloteichus tenebrarius (strain ATCC 17920 / DSM 40477 / JCM 4838 / CBS 697.72 / NBRC 16177 / NCIMB 11028 / NRRL B-12390 / A12253. 1 / ISP 5477) TaxID=1933 RepID=A0ABT1I3Y1_STRSD|nr:HNH endonuclease [Streptoalloteichus tenebrarius]MCP2262433.1 HNH endonuclease [Streptoalloteichus tenebrarius]BFF00792.1 hypothetical protein GCM10020241_24670 [Streptoalloteichus tenebrarius]
MDENQLLTRLRSLRRAPNAPHKPLFLLWLLHRFATSGSTSVHYADVEEPVGRLIERHAPPTPHVRPDRAAVPFVQLERELWEVRDGAQRPIDPDMRESGRLLRERDAHGRLREPVERLLKDSGTFEAAWHALLTEYFPPETAKAVATDVAGRDLGASLRYTRTVHLSRHERDESFEERLREAAIDWLRELTRQGDGTVTLRQLTEFRFEDKRVPLVNPPKEIWTPAPLEAALSILTTYTPPGEKPPYADAEGPDGLLRYKYEGDNPQLSTNVALRRAYERRLPLIWFVGVDRGIYLPRAPIWIAVDEPDQLQVAIALTEDQIRDKSEKAPTEIERRYARQVTRQRLHQPMFRTQVLRAYGERCAVCGLPYQELLDAAHIRPDSHPDGHPVVSNGLALCRLHHAAFDAGLLGIRPDLHIEIHPRVRADKGDDPVSRHGLRELHGRRLAHVPGARRDRPDPTALEARYRDYQERVARSR